MVGQRFDRLSKVLSRFTTRRSLLQGITSALVAGLTGLTARGSTVAGLAGHAASERFDSSAPPLDDVLLAYWRRAGGVRSWLGAHISGPEDLADGDVAYFERGALWRGPASDGEVIASTLHPPLMGCPDLCTTTGALFEKIIQWGKRPEFPIREQVVTRIQEVRPNLFLEIWDGRLALRPVLRPAEYAEFIPLVVSPPVSPPETVDDRPIAVQDALSSPGVPLRNRTLYDIVMISGALVSPSALYAQNNWDTFTFIHATDLHVNRRSDAFKGILRLAPHLDQSGVDQVVNYNDGTRDLMRYANRLHDDGLVVTCPHSLVQLF